MADAKKDDAVANTAAAIAKADQEAQKQGFFGEAVDETPREHYTLAGVIAGKPTPETPDSK